MNPSIVHDVAEIAVNGRVLQWARELRNLSVDDASGLLKISAADLRAYELGQRMPNVTFLRLMSAKYKINFTSLLMDEPLPVAPRPADYRANAHKLPLSLVTIVAIEEVQEAVEAFGEFQEEDAKVVSRLNIGTAELSDDPELVAAKERRRFQVSVEEQQTWHDDASARRQWRKRIEERGVFTYMIGMPTEELSGFSLYKGNVAAICVNDQQITEGRKIFTLLHEYAHLLLRRGGISDENNKNRVERFCNQFAGSFLMPLDALVDAIGDIPTPHNFSDFQIRRLSTKFRVSNRAVAMRLQETGLAPEGYYAKRTAPWDAPKEKPKPRGKQKVNYVTLRMKRIGELHTDTVLRAAKRKVINVFDASGLTGLNPAALARLQQQRIG